MNKRVWLTIKGSHRNTEGESSSMELITEGCLIQKDGVFHIEYEESEISGKEGTKTRISIEDNSVSMQRSGTTTSQFFFEQGKKYSDSFVTPFGAFQMDVYPTRVKHTLGEKEGSLNLKYQLDIDGKSTGTNELTLSYK